MRGVIAKHCVLNYFTPMTKLEKIEQDIKSLNKNDMQRLADWFAELRADKWDEQIERDAKSGKLDKLVSQAKADIAAGRVTPL